MATSSVRSLVDSQAILFIRESSVRCTLTDVRPNTRLYVFFDSEDVTPFCVQNTNGAVATSIPVGNSDQILLSDSAGQASFTFFITGGKYPTGNKTMIVADVPDLSLLDIGGNVYGYATATYNTQGTTEVYQTTTTNTTIVQETVVQYYGDPLAQSFFTYGVKGGVYVTAIELFFQSKDSTLPVWVELREMINGYPAPLISGNPDLVSTLVPSQVNLSNDASVGTIFRFNVPVYLKEDTDYCFVALANTNRYNIFTSAMGERSLENGAIIFEQPYAGSMFKSQNNSTWSAEQFEDLKFNIYRAEFKTGSGNMTLVASTPSKVYQGERFYTTTGSDKIILKGIQQHGLAVADQISISVEAAGTYNGISGTNFNGHKTVTRVIDDYVLEFQSGANATSTGQILTSGKVFNISVLNAGSGYTSAPLVTVAAPVSGTQATATAEVYAGKVTRIIVTNPGSGYTTSPAVIIDGLGVGASAIAPVDVIVTVTTNKSTHTVSPQIKHSITQDTGIDTKIRLTGKNYGFAPEKDITLSDISTMSGDQMIVSRQNEFTKMGNARSAQMDILLRSTNPNVSPVIDSRPGLSMFSYTSAINDLSSEESTTSTIATSGVVGYTGLYGGTGYSTAPTVTIFPAENDQSTSIVNATATASISGGSVTSLSISAGSGYTKPPTIIIDPPPSGTTATAQAQISLINSEINNIGNAYSRYITKKISLSSTSTAVKLSSYLYSIPTTNVEWYIRTSLSSDATAHEDNKWVILKCDIPRDKSSKKGQFLDYDFYLLDIPEFDTYDLKCILSSTNQTDIPFVKNYRVVVAA